MDCGGFQFLWSIGAIAMGTFTTYLAFLAWRKPESSLVKNLLVQRYPLAEEADPISRFFGLTREKTGERDFKSQRLLGLIIGPLFIIAGFVLLAYQSHCPNLSAEFTSATHLQFRFWPPMVLL